MSMVVGYPMNDVALDRAYEDESARIWEEQNDPGTEWDRLLDSVGYMNVAVENLEKGIDGLVLAKDPIEGIAPAEDRLTSLTNDLEDLVCDIKKLLKDFCEGKWRNE